MRGAGKKRRRKLNDQHWCAVAEAYNWALRGGRRGIYQRMADFLNEEEEMGYDAGTMKWMTDRARQYGFLPRPGQGKPKGGYGEAYYEYKEKKK